MINNPVIRATAFFHETGKRQNKVATARLRMKRKAVGCVAAVTLGRKSEKRKVSREGLKRQKESQETA